MYVVKLRKVKTNFLNNILFNERDSVLFNKNEYLVNFSFYRETRYSIIFGNSDNHGVIYLIEMPALNRS